MTRRGFIATLLGAVGVSCLPKPEPDPPALHLRFTDYSATRIDWTSRAEVVQSGLNSPFLLLKKEGE